MSRRLADINIGPILTGRTPRTTPTQLPTYQQMAPQPVAPQIPGLDYLQRIPGINPFLIHELIPDLLYLLDHDGLRGILEIDFPVPEESGVTLAPTEIPADVTQNKLRRKQVMDAFQLGGVQNAINEILFPGNQPVTETAETSQLRTLYLNRIREEGVMQLEQLVANANPQKPNSIIFNHRSQKVHLETQKIEIEIIQNEPELTEREGFQCECGSSRVQVTTKQLRRADEPPTIFARCVECKRQWRSSQA